MKQISIIVLLLASTANADPRVFNVLGYVKGTASQIREQLNGEVERIDRALSKNDADHADANMALSTAIAKATAEAQKDERYTKAHSDWVDAKVALDAARLAGERQAIAAASVKHAQCRAELFRAEKVVAFHVEADAAVMRANELATRLAGDRARLFATREKAAAWRDNLKLVIRNSYTIFYPPDAGKSGVIQSFTPSAILSDGSIYGEFGCPEIQDPHAAGEGITIARFHYHTYKIVIEGSGIRKITPDVSVPFYSNVTVIRSGLFNGEWTAWVKVTPSELDDLMVVATEPVK